jgi:hypothetical protein
VLERLRPRLVTFEDERGRELLDVPGAPFPDPDTPAPPRLLPEYDNVWLSHDDRSRIVRSAVPLPRGPWRGSVLVDGFVDGAWAGGAEDATATLSLHGVGHDALDAVVDEGEALLRLLFPAVSKTRVDVRRR